MLSLMTLFVGIFLPDFCILHILSQILQQFSQYLRSKTFLSLFFFHVNSMVLLTYKKISMRYIHSLQNKMHIQSCFAQSKNVQQLVCLGPHFFPYMHVAASFKIWKVYVWVANGTKIFKYMKPIQSNCLLLIHHYFLLLIILILQQMN